MTEPKSDRTSSGRTLTDEEIDALSDEVAETDHDVEALKTRRRVDPRWDRVRPTSFRPVSTPSYGRRSKRAEAEHTTTSEIIRDGIRRLLEVA